MNRNRFARTELLLGTDAMERLTKAHVTVAGLGAVGSYAVEGLARAGIGYLRLIDFDHVRESNINRQLYALDSSIGQLKTDIACERVRDINPDCELEKLDIFIDASNVNSILEYSTDIVIDAIDSLSPKLELIAAAVNANIPIISCMGAATRKEPLSVRIADISKTDICPLARLVRKRLKKRGVTHGVTCVFSIEEAPDSNVISVPADAESDLFQRGRARPVIGSLSCMPGIFGLTAAQVAINMLAAAADSNCAEIEPAPSPQRR